MARFWFGVGLMLALLAVGIYSVYAIGCASEPIAKTLEQAATAGEPARREALLDQAKQAWDHHWEGTAVVADHGPMDEIDSLFAQAKAYAQAGQWGDFSAFCLRLSQLIQATAEGQKATWWNFL